MKWLWVIAILVVCVWIGLRRLEYTSLYFPDRSLFATPAQVGMTFEDVWMLAADGTKIHGWWVSSGSSKAQTLLFCHGNAGNISHRLDKTQRLLKAGANVFLFDYRGYGQSQGRPSEKGTYLDAAAAYRYLTETRQIPPKQIILYGESLGAAVAVETALHHPVAGIILESAFTSTVDMGRLVFPWLPVERIVRYRYDNLVKLPRLQTPLLFLHSRQDEIVPFAMSEKNLAAAAGPKKIIELRGDHNEGYIDSGDIYIKAIADFLKTKSDVSKNSPRSPDVWRQRAG